MPPDDPPHQPGRQLRPPGGGGRNAACTPGTARQRASAAPRRRPSSHAEYRNAPLTDTTATGPPARGATGEGRVIAGPALTSPDEYLPGHPATPGLFSRVGTSLPTSFNAGVDTTVIALWMGHENVATTQIYIHADLALKERAIARTAPQDAPPGRYQPPDIVLAFLDGL
jgi:hypothetical protein